MGELFLEPQDKLYSGETILICAICGDGEMKGSKEIQNKIQISI